MDRSRAPSWGGHRVWLGPQGRWPKVWPPFAAWEASGSANAKAEGGRLELDVPPAPDGWPRLVRIYEFSGGRLLCRVEMSGGSRPAQIIQIFQTPPETRVRLRLEPTDRWPRGFVELRPGALGLPPADFAPPPQARIRGEAVALRYTGKWVKLGFRPQSILAWRDGASFRVGAPRFSGAAVGSPDAGFFTQIYLGNPTAPVVELEQLSPLFAAGSAAESDLWLDVAPAPAAESRRP